MGGELVDSSPEADSTANLSYRDTFYKWFPYYLAIGMTYDQYWNDDCCLTRYYREAQDYRREMMNQELWLQGLYVYEAILDVAPILHAFAKKGTKPLPYTKEPYPLTTKAMVNKKEREARMKSENARSKMMKWASLVNEKMKAKEVRDDG